MHVSSVKSISETNPQLVARLLKQGGKALLVGGNVTQWLTQEYLDHPQIVVWDDQRESIKDKEVPSTTKVILWTRFVSHPDVGRLNDAAARLRLVKFPMLTAGDVKRLLGEVVHPPNEIRSEPPTVVAKSQPMATVTVRVKRPIAGHGQTQAFIRENYNKDVDYDVRGSIATEARRLFKLSEERGFKTTFPSLEQALRIIVRPPDSRRAPVKEPTATIKKSATSVVPSPLIKGPDDDFEVLESMIEEVIMSLKLIQEHLPKVRKETERVRGLKEQMMRLLNGKG